MKTNLLFGPSRLAALLAALAGSATPLATLRGQDPAPPAQSAGVPFTLAEARGRAREASPALAATREAMSAASARARQAGAFSNPTLSYQREQTSASGATASQSIVSVDQPIELGGLRDARIDAARLRREIAEARLRDAEAQLDLEVTRAYAMAVAADRRAELAQQAANAFTRARTVSETRLAQGDVSGYAHRRIGLESARYAGLLAEALLERRTSHLLLASLIGISVDSLNRRDLSLDGVIEAASPGRAIDSLRQLGGRHRAELRVAALEAEAAAADARLIRRERIPVPVLSAGLKNERLTGAERLTGFVAGISLPVPAWDRRHAAVEAANADARRRTGELEVVRQRIAREVEEAAESFRAVEAQVRVLRPLLGAELGSALTAAHVAYSEGEITLVEWLDAVRAYQEAEATYAVLRAESLIRWAALERAAGVPLSRGSR